MNAPTVNSLEQEGPEGPWISKGKELSDWTSQEIVNILERRPATWADVQDWFSHRWGYQKIKNLRQRLSTYMYVARYANDDLWLPYILPEDEGELYRICTGSAPENREKIFHRLHNILSENTSDKITWYMGREELGEWYRTADESGKTGKEYIIDAIKNHFWLAWKATVLEINRKRKFQNKGILGGTIFTIARYCWKRIHDLAGFLELFGETPDDAEVLAKQYENIPKNNQQENKPHKTPTQSRYSIWPKVKNNERIVRRDGQLKQQLSIISTLKDWEINLDEKERFWKHLLKQTNKTPWNKNKKTDFQNSFPGEEHMCTRIYFNAFLRGLTYIWVPESLLTEDYITFALDKDGDGLIHLHPFLYNEIGGDMLSILIDRSSGTAEHTLENTVMKRTIFVYKVLPMWV